MSEKLQQAIAATRAGDKREAQQLLADALEENPNDEHAWFLLGNLVDSPEKRKAYLGQALAINPQNAKAKQQFGQVQREIAATPVMARNAEVEIDAIDDEAAADMPDWLDDSASDEEIPEVVNEGEAETAVAKVATAVTPSPKSDVQIEREKQLRRYNLMLAFLVFAIIVVLVFLFVL